jgi:hypothetical protein
MGSIRPPFGHNCHRSGWMWLLWWQCSYIQSISRVSVCTRFWFSLEVLIICAGLSVEEHLTVPTNSCGFWSLFILLVTIMLPGDGRVLPTRHGAGQWVCDPCSRAHEHPRTQTFSLFEQQFSFRYIGNQRFLQRGHILSPLSMCVFYSIHLVTKTFL